MKNILVFPISFLMAILAGLRALIDAIFSSEHKVEVITNELQSGKRARVNIEQKSLDVAREALCLEQENELAVNRFQTLFFKIEELNVVSYDRVEILISDVAGGTHFWVAGVDQMELLVCDERIPTSLLHAIGNTASPSSTLSDLARLIQAEVDIQITALHRSNRRRIWAIPDLGDVSTIQPVGFAK